MNLRTNTLDTTLTAQRATFAGWDPDGCPVVHVRGVNHALPAVTTVPLSPADVGCEVVVQSLAGEDAYVILGRLLTTTTNGRDAPPPTLEITGERQVTLRCGKASITLTREGKIILRGTYISSRSSGANRIKGGSVHLN